MVFSIPSRHEPPVVHSIEEGVVCWCGHPNGGPMLTAERLAAIRKALVIGHISWDGDGWYAKDRGYDYEDSGRAFDAAFEALAALEADGE